jgi:WD40 repeat protein
VKEKPPGRAEPTQTLDEILAEYLLAAERGQEPSRQALLARHPDLAGELAAFFAQRDRFRRLAAPLALLGTDPKEDTADPERTPSHGGPRGADTAPALPCEFGDYELLAELGRGAMGVVYRARQKSAGRSVAIKMIRGGALTSAAEAQRFRNEAQIVASLDHPHIIPLYEVGEHDGQPFFSMKLVEGASLAEKLPRYRTDPRAAARLVGGVARAVHHAHQRGVLHRDLKPSNVLLDAEGRPHVGDFGLAKRVETDSGLTQSGAIVGTPSYMAPEQASGNRGAITTATDVYGLGALLYALLCGRPPFQGPTVLETLLQVRTCEPASPRAVNPGVPRDLETICLKCLHKEPDKRYGSAEELAADLERHLAGEPIEARAVGQAERAWRWCCRNPLPAALTAAVALSLLAGTVIASYFAVQADQRARAEAEARKRADDALALADKKAKDETAARELADRKAKDEADARRDADANAKAEARARKEAERQLAISKVLFAQSEWREDNIAHARAVLDEVSPEQRFWEWGYLRRAFEGGHLTLSGHTSYLNCVAFSPDGRRIATASSDRTVKVWDTGTGQEVLTLTGHGNPVYGVAFSPDGQRIATASWDNTARVWDARTGKQLLSLAGHIGSRTGRPVWVQSVAFSPDGLRLATAGHDGTAKVWDARTGKELATCKGHGRYLTSQVLCVAFSPDGQRLATGGEDHTAKVWDAVTGNELFSLEGHPAGRVNSVCFSPDGQRIATASQDRTAKVWDANTRKELLTIKGHTRDVHSVCFSPDGQRLATGGGGVGRGEVMLWDAGTGQELLNFKGHTNTVHGVCFSPDGQRLATASWDNTAKLWDARAGQECLILKGHTGPVLSVAFSPDGQRLATGSADLMAFNSIIKEDHTAKVWDARSGRQLLSIPGHTGPVTGVAFSPDGRRLATAGPGGPAKVWDANTGQELLTLRGHTDGVASLAFSADGRRLATAGYRERTVKVWDADSGQELLSFKGNTGEAMSVAFSPDGRRLAARPFVSQRLVTDGSTKYFDRGIKVWDVSTGQELLTIEGLPLRGSGLIFSPDGQRLYSAGKVWDASTGQELLSIPGGGPRATFSPDGQRLATSSGGGMELVRVWDARTSQELVTLKAGSGSVQSVAFSPDGRRLAAAWNDTRVVVWNAGAGQDVPQPDADELAFRAGMARLDPFWQEEQDMRCERDGQWFAAAFHLGQLLQPRPDDPLPRLRRAWAWAEAGRWQDAHDDFARLVELMPDQGLTWHALALTELALNQPKRYRQTCDQFFRHFDHPPEAVAVGLIFGSSPWNAPATAGRAQSSLTGARLVVGGPGPGPRRVAFVQASLTDVQALIAARRDVVRACVVRRDALADPARLLPLADDDPLLRAAVLCRAGRHEDAVKALAGSKDPFAVLFRALAEHGLGKDDAAKQSHDEALRQTNAQRLSWDRRLEVDLLSNEVAALLHPDKP